MPNINTISNSLREQYNKRRIKKAMHEAFNWRFHQKPKKYNEPILPAYIAKAILKAYNNVFLNEDDKLKIVNDYISDAVRYAGNKALTEFIKNIILSDQNSLNVLQGLIKQGATTPQILDTIIDRITTRKPDENLRSFQSVRLPLVLALIQEQAKGFGRIALSGQQNVKLLNPFTGDSLVAVAEMLIIPGRMNDGETEQLNDLAVAHLAEILNPNDPSTLDLFKSIMDRLKKEQVKSIARKIGLDSYSGLVILCQLRSRLGDGIFDYPILNASQLSRINTITGLENEPITQLEILSLNFHLGFLTEENFKNAALDVFHGLNDDIVEHIRSEVSNKAGSVLAELVESKIITPAEDFCYGDRSYNPSGDTIKPDVQETGGVLSIGFPYP